MGAYGPALVGGGRSLGHVCVVPFQRVLLSLPLEQCLGGVRGLLLALETEAREKAEQLSLVQSESQRITMELQSQTTRVVPGPPLACPCPSIRLRSLACLASWQVGWLGERAVEVALVMCASMQ